MRLVEIVRGKATGKPAIATGMALAKTLRKIAVLARNSFGFISNRTFLPYMEQAVLLVEEGATPEQVDRVLTDFGMAMGPLAVLDLSGIDVFRSIEQAGGRHSRGLDILFAAGRYGQKSGAGWYRYDAARKPLPDQEAPALVQKGHRTVADEEILDRCLYALINEGARVLEEGVALRPVDIDMVYLTGFGFPAWRGGPMFHADLVGLAKVLGRIREFGWQAAPLLERLAREGKKFNELNR
jgi:3-hydroxyacyl-CoA dehydrogenase